MLEERSRPQPEQPPRQLSPEHFSHVCDSLVDYQIPSQTSTMLGEAIKNNRLVVILLTHQSYFDIEICRYACEQFKNHIGEPTDSYLLYSAPAVGKNIGILLSSRKDVYDNCHLKMLGVVRSSDITSPKYKDEITPEMIETSEINKNLYNKNTSLGGCISFIPFEATLHSGRINELTGKINGMKEVTNNPSLIQAIRQKAIIVPFGIDGSYKIVDPDQNILSNLFYDAIFTRNPQKVVTAKMGQPIDLLHPEYQGKSTRSIYHLVTVEVAKLVTLEAQGEYRKYLAA